MSRATTHINRIVELLEPIAFAGTTLGNAGIIIGYQKSGLALPNIQIVVFRGAISTQMLESKVQKYSDTYIIRIRANADDREQTAQEDLYTLEESIINVLQDKTSDSVWGNGYLDVNSISSNDRNFSDGFYTKEISFTIYTREIISV